MTKERIDKILSHEGFGSRKDIKRLLRSSDVLVNGKQIFDAGTLIDADRDSITVDGEEVNLHGQVYLMMNKIQHTVSSNKDGEHQTVFDLLDESFHTPYLEEKLHLIGRLDMDTEGLLLFTTDGELTHRIISPKNHIDKTYFCVLEHPETEQHKKEIEQAFAAGVHIMSEDNEPEADCLPARVKWAAEEECILYTKNSSMPYPAPFSEGKAYTAAFLTITEGKYHQVKRMFQAVGNKVIFLKRLSMGCLKLDLALQPGQYRYLSEEEAALLDK